MDLRQRGVFENQVDPGAVQRVLVQGKGGEVKGQRALPGMERQIEKLMILVRAKVKVEPGIGAQRIARFDLVVKLQKMLGGKAGGRPGGQIKGKGEEGEIARPDVDHQPIGRARPGRGGLAEGEIFRRPVVENLKPRAKGGAFGQGAKAGLAGKGRGKGGGAFGPIGARRAGRGAGGQALPRCLGQKAAEGKVQGPRAGGKRGKARGGQRGRGFSQSAPAAQDAPVQKTGEKRGACLGHGTFHNLR